MKRVISLILCFILILTCFYGCTNGETDSLTIYYPVTSGLTHLDPQIAENETERIVVENCFEGLVTLNENNEIVPGVATSWTISENGLKYVFNLRTDTAWHVTNTSRKKLDTLPENFNPKVTAYDFEFGLSRAIDETTNAPDRAILSAIKSVKAVSDYTLEIELSYRDSDFLYSLTRPVAMPCNEIFFRACKGRYGLALEYMLCNGPFFLYAISEDVSVLITKSDEYKGESEAIPDNVYLYINTDTDAMAEKIRNGKYDGGLISAEMYEKLFSNTKKFTVSPRSSTVWAYCFNENNEYLANGNIRKAFAYGFDSSLTETENELYKPINRITTQYMVPSYEFSPSTENYNEQLAIQSLKKGLADFEDDIKSFTVLTTENFAPQVKAQIQKWQKALGIDVKIKTDTQENVISAIDSGDYEIAFCPVSYDSDRIFALLSSFESDSASNLFGFKNTEYDNLLNSVRSLKTDDEKIATYKKLEQMLIDNTVMIPVFTQNSYFVMGKGVSGIFAISYSEVYFKNADRK